MIAAHQTMMGPQGAPPPWDYRVEYIDCVSDSAYVFLEWVHPLQSAVSELEECVVIGTDLTSSVDKKFFGVPYHYNMSIYGGKWRPSAAPSEWATNSGPSVSTYRKVRYRLTTSDGIEMYSMDGTKIYTKTGVKPSTDTAEDGQTRYARRSFGVSSESNGDWLTQGARPAVHTGTHFGAHRLYDYYRKLNGAFTHHMIPCVLGSVAGFYEEVSGVFYPSETSTPFTAGPKVDNDYNPLGA